MPGSEHATNSTDTASRGDAASDHGGALENAEARLARAIGRLEAALDAMPEPSQDGGATAPDPELAAELERLAAENGELRALVGEAAGQLDGAIARLKRRVGA